MSIETVIGIEIHVELSCETKIFCGCENAFGGGINSRVCPICMGLPGTLPVLNENAVRLAVRSGYVLDCSINKYSEFDRKNYFYPDLPKGYQITQQRLPICGEGKINGIRIERIHLEEDAGKLLHEGEITRIDYNRCGVPLIEIVTKPDFSSGEEVCEFVEEIAKRLEFAGVSDVKIEEGSLRVDLNVSVRKHGEELGERCEIKNLNSYRSIRRAARAEAKRQIKLIESGERVKRQTLRFDEDSGKTVIMRSKEDMSDYRYLPEADIPPILLTDGDIEEIVSSTPELYVVKKNRYKNELKIGDELCDKLLSEPRLSKIFDNALKLGGATAVIASVLASEYGKNDVRKADAKKLSEAASSCATLVSDGKISKGNARLLFSQLVNSGEDALSAAERLGIIISSDSDEIEMIIDKIIKENPQAVSEYQRGKTKAFGFMMGQVMRVLSADPVTAQKILRAKLDEF